MKSRINFLLVLVVVMISSLTIPVTQANFKPNTTMVLSQNSVIGSILIGDTDNINVPYSVLEVDDELFISSYGENKVKVFDKSGNFIRYAFGGLEVDGAGDMDSNGSHIFLQGLNNDSIYIFDLDENLVDMFGESGTSTGQINRIYDIYINDTNILALDGGSGVILIYSLSGDYQSNITFESGIHRGFTQTDDHIIVTDTDANNLEIYSHSGTYLHSYSGHPFINLNSPWDILSFGKYYVVANASSIVILDHGGQFKYSISMQSLGFSLFTKLTIIDGKLYATDQNTRRVAVFDINAHDLSVQADSTSIRISWSGSPDAEKYNIYRGQTSGEYAKIATVQGDVNHFVDEVVVSGQQYFYSVTVVTDTGETDYSEEVSATTQQTLQNDSNDDSTGDVEDASGGFLPTSLLGFSTGLVAMVIINSLIKKRR